MRVTTAASGALLQRRRDLPPLQMIVQFVKPNPLSAAHPTLTRSYPCRLGMGSGGRTGAGRMLACVRYITLSHAQVEYSD